jgi:hypothetical protein
MVEQKHWKWIGLGAAALVGAAVVWGMMSGDEEEVADEVPDDEVLEALKAAKLD